VPPDRRTALVTLSTEAAETPSEFEGWSLTDDGRSIPVSVRTSRIKYLGQPALLLNVADITERKRFEEELRRTADELELRVQSRTAALARANEILRDEISERIGLRNKTAPRGRDPRGSQDGSGLDDWPAVSPMTSQSSYRHHRTLPKFFSAA